VQPTEKQKADDATRAGSRMATAAFSPSQR